MFGIITSFKNNLICLLLQTYVQDMLRRHSAEVYNLIDQSKGHFYVCGDVQMAAEVGETLEGIISKEGKMTLDKAKAYMSNMRVSAIGGHWIHRINDDDDDDDNNNGNNNDNNDNNDDNHDDKGNKNDDIDNDDDNNDADDDNDNDCNDDDEDEWIIHETNY